MRVCRHVRTHRRSFDLHLANSLTLRLGVLSSPGTHMNSFSLFHTPGFLSSKPIQGSNIEALGFLDDPKRDASPLLSSVGSSGLVRNLPWTRVLQGMVNLIRKSSSLKISTVNISPVRAKFLYAPSPSDIRHLKISDLSFVWTSSVRLLGMNWPV